uniref:Expression site-associated gene 1 (ESAG1) protein, putative n=1 Tax=Trypanosoma brucei brucei (strain 927/4 GUTat10.1) TaxID=185431 RepID=Q4FKC9_TRYB2|nr:expression site-associated gene 1 (ESAG1) protein, putative [Trypanosoma brucei brucei TREU927]
MIMVAIVKSAVLIVLVVCFTAARECTSLNDYDGISLDESVCYLKCLSNALYKLYTDGEKKLFVNEEVYANASRILDDMEGKTGESVKYLSVISRVMAGKHDKLEKLISYGNEMGDLVANVGGLFAEVNESVRAVRKEMPDALIIANKYYTAIAEIARTVWDDVKALESGDQPECTDNKFKSVGRLKTTCGNHTCPLVHNVNDGTLNLYGNGCLDINVLSKSGSVRECFNIPRNKLYRNGVVKGSSDIMKWTGEYGDKATRFQLTIHVQKVFGPLIAPFSVGKPLSSLLEMITNITSLYRSFNAVHRNFALLLLDTNLTESANSTDSPI